MQNTSSGWLFLRFVPVRKDFFRAGFRPVCGTDVVSADALNAVRSRRREAYVLGSERRVLRGAWELALHRRGYRGKLRTVCETDGRESYGGLSVADIELCEKRGRFRRFRIIRTFVLDVPFGAFRESATVGQEMRDHLPKIAVSGTDWPIKYPAAGSVPGLPGFFLWRRGLCGPGALR